MELLFEFLLELLVQILFTDLVFKLVYHLIIKPFVAAIGYLSFSAENLGDRTLNAKNALSWNELEEIGWQRLSGFLGILLAILMAFVLFCSLN